jgi:hypothetical protein
MSAKQETPRLRLVEIAPAYRAVYRASLAPDPTAELLASIAMAIKAQAGMLLRESDSAVDEVERSYVLETALRRIEDLSSSAVRLLSGGPGTDFDAEHAVVFMHQRTCARCV